MQIVFQGSHFEEDVKEANEKTSLKRIKWHITLWCAVVLWCIIRRVFVGRVLGERRHVSSSSSSTAGRLFMNNKWKFVNAHNVRIHLRFNLNTVFVNNEFNNQFNFAY